MNDRGQSLKHKLDQRGVELKSLFELSQILNASLDVRRVLNNCLLTPMGRMMISRGLALSADEKGGFVIKVVKGLPSDLLERKIYFKRQFSGPSLLHEMPDESCPNKEFLESLGIELIVPMLNANKMVGAICFGPKITKQEFAAHEFEFLASLSSIAASAIENAFMFQRLEEVNRRLDKKVQELNTLFEVGKELNSTLDTNKILNILVFTIMGEMAVNKMLIYLQKENRMEPAVSKGMDVKPDAVDKDDANKLLINLAVPRMIDENADEFSPWRRLGLRVAVPLRIREETRGVLLLGPKMSRQPYKEDEIEFLSTLGNRAMISLENARLFQEALEKERLEEEIAIAREIQQRLLPNSFPELKDFDIYGLNIPSRQVGGDYFDCFLVHERRLVVAIGDVSGKGVGASLLMSNLHAGLHTLLQSGADIRTIVKRLNDLIYANTNFDKFITFFYAEIDPAAKTMTYVNAGHNPPYIFHADGSFELLEKGGLLLGMMPDVEYETGEVLLRPGDRLVTFTDGVTEAQAVNGDMYEEERLEELIARAVAQGMNIRQLADVLIKELEAFSHGAPQADDITMLGLHVVK